MVTDRTPHRSKWSRKLALGTGVVVGMLVGAEGVARLSLGPPPARPLVAKR